MRKKSLRRFLPFEQRYRIDEQTGCWIWLGATLPNGYPSMRKNKIHILAYRYSYELKYGQIPLGMNACHKCDTPMCVNPDHIFIGSQSDNIRDMVLKKRNRTGENASWSKLKQCQVNDIRKEYGEGNISHRKLAERYNVSYSAIRLIVLNKNWRTIS